jgi:hypothetical protein
MMDAKTDLPGVYRTPDGFLINKDNNALAAYKARRQRDKEMDTLKDDVSSLKNDIQEIKDLLKGLVK